MDTQPARTRTHAEIGCNVETKFRGFGKSVMYYEKKLFSTWSDSINTITMQHLKQPIFLKSSITGRVEVNFHTDLIELIRETRYLDRMGFPIPEIALNVALQVCALCAPHLCPCRLCQGGGASYVCLCACVCLVKCVRACVHELVCVCVCMPSRHCAWCLPGGVARRPISGHARACTACMTCALER